MEIKFAELQKDIKTAQADIDCVKIELSSLTGEISNLKLFDTKTKQQVKNLDSKITEISIDVKKLLSRDGENWNKFVWIVVSLIVGWAFGNF